MEELNRKGKHNHKWTDKLKVIIFAIVMLAPFFAILVECCAISWNPYVAANYTGTPTQIFYDAIDNLNTQPIFNWTSSTAIYTAINNMCTGLEFGTSGNTLSLLLTYWSLNTAIYIVFDIIIYMFTKLTHFMNE